MTSLQQTLSKHLMKEHKKDSKQSGERKKDRVKGPDLGLHG